MESKDNVWRFATTKFSVWLEKQQNRNEHAPSGVREGERKTARSFRGSGRGVGDWIDASKKHNSDTRDTFCWTRTMRQTSSLAAEESLPATPWINTLVSQASQVEEKCFRSKRPNFASKNAFSPSAALRAAACKARVALGRVRQEKSQNKSPEATPRGFCFEVTGQNYNSQFFTIYSLNYTFFNIDFRNNIFIILATNTKYYFGFVDILYKMINRN